MQHRLGDPAVSAIKFVLMLKSPILDRDHVRIRRVSFQPAASSRLGEQRYGLLATEDATNLITSFSPLSGQE